MPNHDLWARLIKDARRSLYGIAPLTEPEDGGVAFRDEAERQLRRMHRLLDEHLRKRLPELLLADPDLADPDVDPKPRGLARAMNKALVTIAHELCGPGGILEAAGPDEGVMEDYERPPLFSCRKVNGATYGASGPGLMPARRRKGVGTPTPLARPLSRRPRW